MVIAASVAVVVVVVAHISLIKIQCRVCSVENLLTDYFVARSCC